MLREKGGEYQEKRTVRAEVAKYFMKLRAPLRERRLPSSGLSVLPLAGPVATIHLLSAGPQCSHWETHGEKMYPAAVIKC